jgi:hypothetical protein
MNKEKVLKLASFLESLDGERFDISSWATIPNYSGASSPVKRFIDYTDSKGTCGTTACLAGWATYLSYEEGNIDPEDSEYNFNYLSLACDWLGLDYNASELLFYVDEGSVWDVYSEEYGFRYSHPDDEDCLPMDSQSITNADAASILRRIASGDIVLNKLL